MEECSNNNCILYWGIGWWNTELLYKARMWENKKDWRRNSKIGHQSGVWVWGEFNNRKQEFDDWAIEEWGRINSKIINHC